MCVILLGLSDGQLIHIFYFSYLKELEDAGAKFYGYQKGFIHQKVMVADDSLSAIRSANLDNRSFRLNFEVVGIVSSTAFNAEVSRKLLADFANSKPTGAEALADRSFWFRLSVGFSRMLTPIQCARIIRFLPKPCCRSWSSGRRPPCFPASLFDGEKSSR